MYIFLVQQLLIHLSRLYSKLEKPLLQVQDRTDLQESPGPYPKLQRVKSQQDKLLLFIFPLSSLHLFPSGEWAGSDWEDTAVNQGEGARFNNRK